MEWFNKNKMIIILALALGGFLIYAMKTDMSFTKNNYQPGQQDPPKANTQQPKMGEADWRRKFEEDREK